MIRKIIGLCICMLLATTTMSSMGAVTQSTIFAISSTSDSANALVNWTQIQKLLASDGETDDYFGYSVSISGGTALIGAYYEDSIAVNSGSVYVFIYSGTTWTQQAKLHASDGAQNDYFGNAVSVDGNTALIGAFQDDNENGANSGAAYVFVRTGSTWTEQAKLLASDGAAYDSFANAVSLDGDTAIIGTPYDDNSAVTAGSAYVFTRTGSTWEQQQKIIAPDPGVEDEFGLSISVEGNTALIGAPGDDSKGSAYVFTRTDTAWSFQAKLIALDGATGDNFGCSVSLSADTGLIGANSKNSGTGAAYVFLRTGVTWMQQTKLLPIGIGPGEHFGRSVSIYGDIALIGAYLDDGTGSAYIFIRSGTNWTEEAKLLASDGAEDDFFGFSVSLYVDTALVGAWYNDDHGTNSGSAYVFIQETENQPPGKPDINGPTTVIVDEETSYTFIAIDPEDDNIYYEIDWGDGTTDSWFGPFVSNVVIQKSHTWKNKGQAIIKARAKDIHGAIGDWEEMSITVPYSYNLPFMQFWIQLFERFPNSFSILRHILGY